MFAAVGRRSTSSPARVKTIAPLSSSCLHGVLGLGLRVTTATSWPVDARSAAIRRAEGARASGEDSLQRSARRTWRAISRSSLAVTTTVRAAAPSAEMSPSDRVALLRVPSTATPR